LLPPTRRALRPWPLLLLVLRFARQSMVAGIDVARRALDPRLPLAPGLLRQPTALPGSLSRALFGALSSQIPGTMAVGSGEKDSLLFHSLDRHQDAAQALAADEALLLRVLGDPGAERERPAR
jgi:multicomponent Na+:H+ antiporter subunit E